MDFEQTIANAPDDAFLFIDPPYFNADQDKFYTHSFDKESHYRLAKILRAHSHRLKFLLTYDNSPEIREIYGWSTQMLDREWNYTISRTDDQSKKTSDKGKRYMGKEVFIMDYATTVIEQAPLPLQLHVNMAQFGLATTSTDLYSNVKVKKFFDLYVQSLGYRKQGFYFGVSYACFNLANIIYG